MSKTRARVDDLLADIRKSKTRARVDDLLADIRNAINDALNAVRDGRRPVKADADRLQDCSEILNQVVADLDGRPIQ